MRSPFANDDSGQKAHSSETDPNRTRGGRISAASPSVIGSGDQPAFVHVAPKSSPLPVLIAVPHAGRAYPPDVLRQFRNVDHSQLRLEDRHVDAVAVEVARATGTGLLVAHAPRAMLDLNRADDDVDWGMVEKDRTGETQPERANGDGPRSNARARSGLGLVPRRLPGFGEIWRGRISHSELNRRIDEIHRPYHSFLGDELARISDQWGAALLIDLHSMPPLKQQNLARNADDASPQIVLGDRFGASCHSSLTARAFAYLDQQGCVSAHNRPYAGGYVLDRHANPRKGIFAIQVELCRSTYLDAALRSPTSSVKPLARMLAGLVRELGAETAGIGAAGSQAQAAE